MPDMRPGTLLLRLHEHRSAGLVHPVLFVLQRIAKPWRYSAKLRQGDGANSKHRTELPHMGPASPQLGLILGHLVQEAFLNPALL